VSVLAAAAFPFLPSLPRGPLYTLTFPPLLRKAQRPGRLIPSDKSGDAAPKPPASPAGGGTVPQRSRGKTRPPFRKLLLAIKARKAIVIKEFAAACAKRTRRIPIYSHKINFQFIVSLYSPVTITLLAATGRYGEAPRIFRAFTAATFSFPLLKVWLDFSSRPLFFVSADAIQKGSSRSWFPAFLFP
jgi:hypothetical protein